jgi:hypothetical protein
VGNTLPADLDVDQLYEASRALDESRAELTASRELAVRLAGGVPHLNRLEQAAETLTMIEAALPALQAAQSALERTAGLLAGARAELAAEAWPPDPDARPILERLQAAVPQLDRLAEVMDLLERAEVIAWRS